MWGSSWVVEDDFKDIKSKKEKKIREGQTGK